MPVTINGSNTPTAGGVTYGDGTQYATTAAGTSGQVLQSNGASAPSWVAAPTTSPAGSNTQIQYNNSGAFGASSAFTFDGTTATTPRLALGGTTLPAAGTATLFSRSSDNNTYLQAGSGNTILLLDGSQNSMASFGSSTVQLLTGNTERIRIASAGEIGIGGANYGTSGQVLTSGGSGAAPTWSTPSSGMTLISTSNYPSGSGTWTVSSVFSSSYSNYIIYIDNLRMDAACDMIYYGWDGTNQDNPASGCVVQARNAAGVQGSSYGSVYLNVAVGAISTGASFPFCAVMFINRYSGQSFYNGTYNSAYKDSPNDQTTLNGSFVGLNTGAYTSFQLVLTGGATFTQGKVFVYGLV